MQPLTIVLRIAVIIFFSEGVIMLFLSQFEPIDSWMAEAVVDASILTLLSSPMTYFWVIQPYIEAQNQAEESLQRVQDELEIRVEKRTEELQEDITRRKDVEEALHESKETLKLHILELQDTESRLESQGAEMIAMAEELAVARDDAEQASRAKSAFLASMSHELRTPLNAIMGFSEMMKNKVFGDLGDDHYDDYAKDIYNSGGHLLSLINDVLDISKVEAGKLELKDEEVDVGKTVESSLDLVRERAAAEKVELLFELGDSLPLLRADERILKQIILNLLSNAIKFTPEGGEVKVSAGVDGTNGFLLMVTDSGIGIAKNDIEKVMTPFGQVDGTLARKHKGTGLGVPLVKELTEMHGGTFLLESEIGKGTVATVHFPPERIIES